MDDRNRPHTPRQTRRIDLDDFDQPTDGSGATGDGDSTETAFAGLLHGGPGALGRWQPTRAGVLNSWKWADEMFHFADGWLAFVGRNGSGKSLTASQLITLLLDGDTSQTALSVAGTKAGTLLSRHTDTSERDDRTGVWWLEFGLTDPDSGDTDYLTVGLWLRSTGGSLLRAFFLTPARVGHDLLLQQDRNAVTIDELAEQLASCGGQLYTDSSRLRPKAEARLSSVKAEAEYRNDVRGSLFAPLDEVQYDALLSVLRTLRSVRTAEKISAKAMLEVLTSALPALDQGRLNDIATAMQRIASLETQLRDTQEQAAELGKTDRTYTLYRRGVALTEAAALRSANTEFDNLTRRQREAETVRDRATTDEQDAQAEFEQIRLRLAELAGAVSAADTALRDHAGAELPHREQRAADLLTAAAEAEQRAARDTADAAEANAEAAIAVQSATQATTGLADLTRDLARTGNDVGADAALTNLRASTTQLTDKATLRPDDADEDVPVSTLVATPLAWVETRRTSIAKATGALTDLTSANAVAVSESEQHRQSQDTVDARTADLVIAAGTREQAEQHLFDAVTGWQQQAGQFPPVPEPLLEADPVDARLSPGRLTGWLDRASGEVRERIDVPGHIARRNAAYTAVSEAERFTGGQRQRLADARLQVTEANGRHAAQVQADAAAEAQDAATDADAVARYTAEVERAATARHDALLEQVRATVSALTELDNWGQQVQSWRTSLVHLPATALPTAAPQELWATRDALATALHTLTEAGGVADRLTADAPLVAQAEQALHALVAFDDTPLRASITDAGAQARARLDRAIAVAERALGDVDDELERVADQLADAERAPAPPPAPTWRTRTGGSPLWSLVDFADPVDPTTRNQVEGALLAAGLLDALVTANGTVLAGDVVLTATAPDTGSSLADVLVVEPGSAVPADVVTAVLRSITLDRDGAHLSVRTGVLTGAAPAGYVAQYVGTSARERARLALVAQLRAELARLEQQREDADALLHARQAALAEAVAEVQALPTSAGWQQARTGAQQAQLAAGTKDRQATQDQATAEQQLHAVRSTLAERARGRERVLAELLAAVRTAQALAEQAVDALDRAVAAEAGKRELAEHAAAALEDALVEQEEADAQREAFPSLDALLEARAEEDLATGELTAARGRELEVAARLRTAQERARKALVTLNRLLDLGQGTMLPSDADALHAYDRRVEALGGQLTSWQHAAERTVALRANARLTLRRARGRSERAQEQQRKAADARADAVREDAAVRQLRELYGAEYEQLLATREQAQTARQQAELSQEAARRRAQDAAVRAASAQGTLEGIAPQRAAAEQRRERCLQQVYLLFDAGLVEADAELNVDESGRPASLTAALGWGARLLATEPRSSSSRDELQKLLDSRRARLEQEAKVVSMALTRFDRQVTLATIPGTTWHRAVVASPDALAGEDLHVTVRMLRQTAAQLDNDLRDDVKATLKTSMFTALRRDIRTRRAAAQELVRLIRAKLQTVRTGVARVGVEVDWKVRGDEDAQRMVELINAIPSDETFDQMYQVLKERLDKAEGDTWADRVARTFDYRLWHEWDIRVTHASFGDGGQEVFRPLTARSNPLASFSTGESRLATMLPLLAAAWSMYSGPDYAGPRLLFVDEVNAAFDPQNVRKLLGLLRELDFDVLATAPEMSAMLKAEAERVVIAQLTHVGAVRVSIPWLWTGTGRPTLITEEMTTASAGAGGRRTGPC